jgi:hypothetical protein
MKELKRGPKDWRFQTCRCGAELQIERHDLAAKTAPDGEGDTVTTFTFRHGCGAVTSAKHVPESFSKPDNSDFDFL